MDFMKRLERKLVMVFETNCGIYLAVRDFENNILVMKSLPLFVKMILRCDQFLKIYFPSTSLDPKFHCFS